MHQIFFDTKILKSVKAKLKTDPNCLELVNNYRLLIKHFTRRRAQLEIVARNYNVAIISSDGKKRNIKDILFDCIEVHLTNL